jgi:hypothetical protein
MACYLVQDVDVVIPSVFFESFFYGVNLCVQALSLIEQQSYLSISGNFLVTHRVLGA